MSHSSQSREYIPTFEEPSEHGGVPPSSQSSDMHACVKNLYEASMYMASELGGLLDALDQQAEMQKPKARVQRIGGPARKKTKPTSALLASSAAPPPMTSPPSDGAGAGAGAGPAGMYGQPFGAPPSRSEEEYYLEHKRNRTSPGESMAAGPPTPATTQAPPQWGNFGAHRGGYTGAQ